MTPNVKKNTKLSIPIIVAIIGLIGVCITTVGGIIVGLFPDFLGILTANDNDTKITFRVTDIGGNSIPQAKLILLSGNDVHIQYTDTNGVSTFNLLKAETLRVFVETNEYEIYDQIFASNISNPIEVRLAPKGTKEKYLIIRVIDNDTDLPINGAEVILIIGSNIYSQTTDSNGIIKITTEFHADKIDGDITVTTSGFKTERQRVTLQADRVQDIRLDKNTRTITIRLTGEGKEVARTPIAVEKKEQGSSEVEKKEQGGSENVNYECPYEKLTPEEIANCGYHEYLIIYDVVKEGDYGTLSYDCGFGDDNEKHHEVVVRLLIDFPGGNLRISSSKEIMYEKVGPNIYRNEQQLGSYTDKKLITFTLDGLEGITESYYENGDFACEIHQQYLIK